MPDYENDLTLQQVADRIASDVPPMISTAIAGIPNAFINGGTEMTVAQLLANYPADATQLFKYARVSDLYGTARSVMICEASAGSFYWRPQRTDFSASSASTGGAVTLTPLVSPPTLVFTGSLTGNITITPSSTNVWPGCRFEVAANGLLNLLNININGLVGGGTVPLLSGSSRMITYIQGSGWRAA